MPPDHTPRDTEPAHGADAEGAGSVVVGLDPSNPDGVAAVYITVDTEQLHVRLNEAGRRRGDTAMPRMTDSGDENAEKLRQERHLLLPGPFDPSEFESLSAAPVFTEPGPGFSLRDDLTGMPDDGEETPPCPA